tara:strand:- start:1236 stop:1379 length:144 start_codon:yes stop_codon:yes gene_type:complete
MRFLPSKNQPLFSILLELFSASLADIKNNLLQVENFFKSPYIIENCD